MSDVRAARVRHGCRHVQRVSAMKKPYAHARRPARRVLAPDPSAESGATLRDLSTPPTAPGHRAHADGILRILRRHRSVKAPR